MTDYRTKLAANIATGAEEEFLAALDGIRPIVRVGDVHPLAGSAVVSLGSMLTRLFPHAIVEGKAAVGRNPWNAVMTDDANALFSAVRPQATRRPARDFTIAIGSDGAADLYFGGDDWTMRLGRSVQPVAPIHLGLGLQAAAVFACAEVFKNVLGPKGFAHVGVGDQLVWNVFDYQLSAQLGPDLGTPVSIHVALLGAGSVGSSAVGVLACIPSVAGTAVVVDPDAFDPSRNPCRYPSSLGNETGPKANWLASLLSVHGWKATPVASTVASWIASSPLPGFDGYAVSSVDRVDGRLEAADLLARCTLSIGVGGLALHLQREHLGDGLACPYCDFVDLGPPLGQAQNIAGQTGLPVERAAQLLLPGALLLGADIEAAVRAGRVRRDRADELIGRRIEDLVGRAYAEATITNAGKPSVAVSAPFVSWMGGVLAGAELIKASYGLPQVDRRVNLDLSGVPPGFVLKLPAAGVRCVCGASPVRKTWMQQMYS